MENKENKTDAVEIVRLGGGIYKGYQAPTTLKSGKVIGDLHFFDSPQAKSTLVLKSNVLTVENVQEKIRVSDLKFREAA